MPVHISEKDAPHIFRSAPGHVADTPGNRRMLIETVKPKNWLGDDRFGNTWYARLSDDGSQIWVQVRGDRIRNGGINPFPRSFDPLTGLSAPEI